MIVINKKLNFQNITCESKILKITYDYKIKNKAYLEFLYFKSYINN